MKRSALHAPLLDLMNAPAGSPGVVVLPDDIPKEIAELFESLALAVSRTWPRSSADFILHRVRWEMEIERGEREFKCNNNYTATLARWFLARHPELPKFFETRIRKS